MVAGICIVGWHVYAAGQATPIHEVTEQIVQSINQINQSVSITAVHFVGSTVGATNSCLCQHQYAWRRQRTANQLCRQCTVHTINPPI